MNEKKPYSDWDEFGTEEYAWRCYGRKILDGDRAIIEGVMRTMEEFGLVPGSLRHVADVGTGPNLFPAMPLAPFVQPKEQGGRLDLIEYSRPNREYLQEELGGRGRMTSLAYIWDKFETLMSSHSPIWRRTLDRVQNIAAVKAGDIYELPVETYDAISAFFVPESITDSRKQCELAIEKLIDAVKPGGFVMIAHMMESSGWYAGEGVRYPAVPLTVDDLRKLYADKLDLFSIVGSPTLGEVREDDHGEFAVVGRKRAAPLAASTAKAFTDYDTLGCLYDAPRVEFFKQALFEAVKPGDVVVDAGSGTGVLGLLAAQAGAAKVYCLELNQRYVKVIEENAKNNGLRDRIVAMAGDATTADLPEHVDVIVGEIISAGFFYEPQLQVVANLKRFLKPGGTILPMAIENFVELIDAQDELYGLKFQHDTRYRDLNDIVLSTRARYLATDFYQDTPFRIEAKPTVRCMVPGRANAIRISYNIRATEGVLATVPSEYLLNPQIIFLPEPIWLRAGAYYGVSLEYEASSSPLDCKVAIVRLETTAKE